MNDFSSQVIWKPSEYNPKNGELTIIKGHSHFKPIKPIQEINCVMIEIGLKPRIISVNGQWQLANGRSNVIAILETGKPVTLLISYLSEEWLI